MLNALSVDIKDWFQVGAFEIVIARDDRDTLPHRLERNSDDVPELSDRANVKGTFFTPGCRALSRTCSPDRRCWP